MPSNERLPPIPSVVVHRPLWALLIVAGSLAFSPAAFSAVRTIADRYVVVENAGALNLRVLANDGIPSAELANGTLTLVRAPSLGSATIDTSGTATTAADDVVRYQPTADRSGDDTLRYRICGGGNCAEGEVSITVRPVTEALALSVTSGSGYRDIAASGLRALPSARFLTSPLVEGRITEFPLVVDPAPWDPFAGDADVSLRVIPRQVKRANGVSLPMRAHCHRGTSTSTWASTAIVTDVHRPMNSAAQPACRRRPSAAKWR